MQNLMNKLNYQAKHRFIDGEQMTASRGCLRGGGFEQKGKRTHGNVQECGDCWVEGDIRGLNGNGKNTIRVKF